MTLPATLLTLPYPPSGNHAHRSIVRYARSTCQPYVDVILSRAAKGYYATAGWEVLTQRPQNHPWPYREGLTVTLHITPPDRGRRDLDNVAKVLIDLLVRSQVIEDDSLIQELHLYRCPSVAPGQVAVSIATLGD